MKFNLFNEKDFDIIRDHIKYCQIRDHKQQVAYSTFHDSLTQICFTCQKIVSNLHFEEPNHSPEEDTTKKNKQLLCGGDVASSRDTVHLKNETGGENEKT